MPAEWIETRAVRLGELSRYPGNARRGDVAAIRASIRRNGQYRSLVVRQCDDGALVILAGNHTFDALGAEGAQAVRCELIRCDDATALRINLADNRLAELGGYDDGALAELLAGLKGDYEGTGWADEDLTALLEPEADPPGPRSGQTDPDAIPDAPKSPVARPGDLWRLGDNWLLCGDSTNPTDVARVTRGELVTLVHADPPYGMGKEADGVLNDNLHGPRLDAFQLAWWQAWQPSMTTNASAYIWGNAPDLWRLWWAAGLSEQPDLMVRNEIVWDKGSALGMLDAGHHCYPVATERCLFLMRGQQFLGNQNKDAYWPGYEPLRVWLEAERDRAGWANRDVNALTGTQMSGHWFSQSQFMPISRKHYAVLQAGAAGRAFTRDYDELFAEMFPGLRDAGNEHRRELAAKLREQRSTFDNTHEIMRDVWTYPRVTGEDRHGHATPKPVAMVERAFKSSSRPGDLVGVPFAGSGPEFIAAYRLGRRVAACELEPAYVDVICQRWHDHTGIAPEREAVAA